MPIGPPPPPWQWTTVDNGAKFHLNEQPANEPPVTERMLFIQTANGTKLAVNLADGNVENW